jgi:hypothetical protein
MRIPRQIPVKLLDAVFLTLVILILCASMATDAQQSSHGSNPPAPGIPGMSTGPADQDPSLHRMTEKMSLARNVQRQQEIVADTAHLLQLAQKLNDDVSKSDQNTLSLSVVKDADEIEKLAKSVKEKMRDGN